MICPFDAAALQVTGESQDFQVDLHPNISSLNTRRWDPGMTSYGMNG
jgi:hypothetical protein